MDDNSCVIIGGDTLLTECGEILRQKKFKIQGVVSRNPRIKSWADKSDIAFFSLDSDYLSALKSISIDYLFAITHLEILPDEVLSLPKKLSINFHDGPLPAYAGLNTPVWALMNQESEYGISWHKIVQGVDEGDILLQENFKLAPDETSLSLNTKCFAAALNTFPVLLEKLDNGGLTPKKQNLDNRSYYSNYQRPEAASVIDWNRSADELAAQIRALDFGAYPNPLGCVKIVEKDVAYIIHSAIAKGTESAPGEIIRIEEDEIEVGTSRGSLCITAFKSIFGESLSVADFVEQLELKSGDKLSNLSVASRQVLTQLNHKLCRCEDFWTNRLNQLDPIELPYVLSEVGKKKQPDFQSIEFNLDDQKDASAEALISAFVLLLTHVGNKEIFDIYLSQAEHRQNIEGFNSIISPIQIYRAVIDPESSAENIAAGVAKELKLLNKNNAWLKDLIARQPILAERGDVFTGSILPVGIATERDAAPYNPEQGAVLTLVINESSDNARFIFDQNRLAVTSVEKLCRQLENILRSITDTPSVGVSEVSLLSDDEKRKVLKDWNQTKVDYPEQACVHHLFEEQVLRTPDSIALVFEDQELSYKELDQRANRLAVALINQGIGPDNLVGVYVERSLDLMISTLGVLKAGGGYVPLDPDFPADRIKYMIGDAKMPVIVSQQKLIPSLPENDAVIVCVNDAEHLALPYPDRAPKTEVNANNLAYVIYTSGSTGRPKGVMIEHRNVANFFAGMDERVPHDGPGTWLAVTSLSFDISVLELFWTIARGFKVVIFQDKEREAGVNQGVPDAILSRSMGFGLFMWGNDDAPGRAKYRLMLEGAKYFDDNGFDAVWTPERHFAAFGGPYPNPAVTGAALAATTNNISIRSGSCVSPLHHAIRIAEDWSVIDNLSDGRVGLSFASGWQPNDFVIKPENHKNNKEVMLEQIETVRKLWRGEEVAFENPMGDRVNIVTLPRPVQKELPVWVTTAGNPETYKQAGELGANVITHLLGQNLEELAGKIKIYRDARKAAGFDPNTGQVSLMLHTFVGDSDDTVRELVREPMKDYLRSAMKLVVDFAWSFPAFKRPKGTKAEDVDLKALTEEETETILDFAFERYFEKSGLFGTPETCVAMINRCKQADIDEIACLMDFGVDTDAVMNSLPYLKQVKEASNQAPTDDSAHSFANQVHKHNVTHLQCTPSMARMLSISAESREMLKQIDHLMIGGEALPESLAKDLLSLKNSSLTNMYGPTETTIWSTTQMLSSDLKGIPIGRPIANTQIYILDKYRQPTPPGVPGELFIGGDGVVRGYLDRPALTSERFIPNPFGDMGSERIYWTGDLASYREDGTIDFLGRVDHQVKIRGYRIELGEIESALDQHDNIRQSVVVLREDTPGDQRLAAYYVADGDQPSSKELRETLNRSLPNYMMPSDYVVLDALPLTPNGKVDRNALPSPQEVKPASEQVYVAPESGLEEKIVNLWQETLKIDKVGVDDNFFDLGGHSLLVVKLHSELGKAVDKPISLTDLYRFPTVRSLVEHLDSSASSGELKKSSDRAKRRRVMAMRRRKRA